MNKLYLEQLRTNGNPVTETGLSSNQIDSLVRFIKRTEVVDVTRLKLSVSLAYDDSVTYLREKGVDVTVENCYIRFSDSVTEGICANKWGDGTGVTKLQLQSITNSTVGTSTANFPFYNNTEITYFNEFKYFTGVTKLPDGGYFRGCSALVEVTYPDSITSWGTYTMTGCSSLKKVIANGVVSVSNYAFMSCASLESVSMDALEYAGPSSFSGCAALTSISLPKLKTAGNSAFAGITNLRTISMPNLETIGSSTFQSCVNLGPELYFPKLKSLGENAFCGWSSTTMSGITKIANLGEITAIPDAANTAYGGCFRNNKGLTEAVLPTTLVKIGKNAFVGCSALATVTGASNVTTFEYCAFGDCTALASIDLDMSKVTYLGDRAFRRCANLSMEVNFTALSTLGGDVFQGTAITKVLSLGNATAIKDSADLANYGMFRDCKSLTDVILPDTMSFIGNNAFNNCINLSSLQMNQQIITKVGTYAFTGVSKVEMDVNMPVLETIGLGAFNGCALLNDVISLGSITRFEDGNVNVGTFRKCTNLRNVTLPPTLTYIGSYTFYNSGVKNVDMSSALVNIGTYAFNGCTSLEKVERSSFISSIGNNAFQDCTSLKTFGSLLNCTSLGTSAFRNAGATGSDIELEFSEIKTIGQWAFYSSKIKSFDFSNCTSLTTVGGNNTGVNTWNTFGVWQSSAIESISFDNCTSLTKIETGAFYLCSKLKSISLKNCPLLADGCGVSQFNGCASLESIDYSEAPLLNKVGTNAFTCCSSLKEACFNGTNIVTLGTNSGYNNWNNYPVFFECTALEKAYFKSCAKLTSIGDGLFWNCTSLKFARFDDCSALVKIPSGMFNGCSGLKLAFFNGCTGMTTIGTSAFTNCSSLVGVLFGVQTPPTLANGAFDGCPSNMAILVPQGCADSYKSASIWSIYADNIFEYAVVDSLPETLTEKYYLCGGNDLYICDNSVARRFDYDEGVFLPTFKYTKNITTAGNTTLYPSSWVVAGMRVDGVKVAPSSTYNFSTTGVHSVEIEKLDGIITEGAYTLASLESVGIAGFVEVAKRAFIAGSMKSLYMSDSIKRLGDSSFTQLGSLTTVNGNNFWKLTNIEEFGGCVYDGANSSSTKRRILLGDKLTTLGGESGRTSAPFCTLSNVSFYIGSGLTTIYGGAFDRCTIKHLLIQRPIPPTFVSTAQTEIMFQSSLNVLLVPMQYVKLYQAADGWSVYASKTVGYVQADSVPENPDGWYLINNKLMQYASGEFVEGVDLETGDDIL